MSDEDLIKQAVLDYFDGWFDGDAGRMERALHPGLAKRSLEDDGWSLDETTAEWMIDATKRGVGRERDPVDRQHRGRWSRTSTTTSRTPPFAPRSTGSTSNSRAPSEGWKIVNALWSWT